MGHKNTFFPRPKEKYTDPTGHFFGIGGKIKREARRFERRVSRHADEITGVVMMVAGAIMIATEVGAPYGVGLMSTGAGLIKGEYHIFNGDINIEYNVSYTTSLGGNSGGFVNSNTSNNVRGGVRYSSNTIIRQSNNEEVSYIDNHGNLVTQSVPSRYANLRGMRGDGYSIGIAYLNGETVSLSTVSSSNGSVYGNSYSTASSNVNSHNMSTSDYITTVGGGLQVLTGSIMVLSGGAAPLGAVLLGLGVNNMRTGVTGSNFIQNGMEAGLNFVPYSDRTINKDIAKYTYLTVDLTASLGVAIPEAYMIKGIAEYGTASNAISRSVPIYNYQMGMGRLTAGMEFLVDANSINGASK